MNVATAQINKGLFLGPSPQFTQKRLLRAPAYGRAILPQSTGRNHTAADGLESSVSWWWGNFLRIVSWSGLTERGAIRSQATNDEDPNADGRKGFALGKRQTLSLTLPFCRRPAGNTSVMPESARIESAAGDALEALLCRLVYHRQGRVVFPC